MIQNVAHGSLTPMVFTTSGGMEIRDQYFYARLAEALGRKDQQPRSSVVALLRYTLSFSLRRSALVSLEETREPAPEGTHITDLKMLRQRW